MRKIFRPALKHTSRSDLLAKQWWEYNFRGGDMPGVSQSVLKSPRLLSMWSALPIPSWNESYRHVAKLVRQTSDTGGSNVRMSSKKWHKKSTPWLWDKVSSTIFTTEVKINGTNWTSQKEEPCQHDMHPSTWYPTDTNCLDGAHCYDMLLPHQTQPSTCFGL